jgi:hypothetical protein
MRASNAGVQPETPAEMPAVDRTSIWTLYVFPARSGAQSASDTLPLSRKSDSTDISRYVAPSVGAGSEYTKFEPLAFVIEAVNEGQRSHGGASLGPRPLLAVDSIPSNEPLTTHASSVPFPPSGQASTSAVTAADAICAARAISPVIPVSVTVTL